MKRIIDIPDEMWEQVKDGYVPLGISKYLKNGIPYNPKGKWIPMSADCRGYSESFKCSICGAYIYPRCLEKELDYNYCPYCGADMEGENDI